MASLETLAENLAEKAGNAFGSPEKAVANTALSAIALYAGVQGIDAAVAGIGQHFPRLSTAISMTLYPALLAGIYYLQQGVSFAVDTVKEWREYRRDQYFRNPFVPEEKTRRAGVIAMVLLATVGGLYAFDRYAVSSPPTINEDVSLPAGFKK